MANIRTLKLNLLADTTDFAKGIKKATGETESFSGKVSSSLKSVAKSAALAGVAVAGMAVKFGIDAVKAAAEDQASQKRLATALKNTTKASNAQIASVEKYIKKTQLAFGVSDDKLRPAYQRLAQATGSMAKAQELTNLSLNISATTGKSVEVVANSLAKAYGGNMGALKKLGINIDENIIKTKDFGKAQAALQDVTKGAAKNKANTFEGQMARFSEAVQSAKEDIGGLILQRIQPLVDKWLPRIVQTTQDVIDGFSGKKGKRAGFNLGKSIRDVADAIGTLITTFNTGDDGKQRTFAQNIEGIAKAIGLLATAINKIAGAFAALQRFENSKVFKLLQWTPLFLPLNLANREQKWLFGDNGGNADTNNPPVTGDPLKQNRPRRRNFMGGGGTTVINLNGIVDAESARKSIEQVLQSSSIRTSPAVLQGNLI